MQRTRYRARRGTALIEFALVVPMLLLLMLGILEFGWYGKNQLSIANAAREGARLASIGRVQSIIVKRIQNSALPIVVADNNISLQYSTDSGSTYLSFPPDDTSKSPAQNGVPAGTLIRVTITVPHKRLINAPITPATTVAKVTMLRERV
jgi:Flp pilus assembly protein TadG